MNQGDRNPWVEVLFRPLVIGVMFACIALSLVELVRLFFPTWNGTFLILLCVLATLEANYSYRLIRASSLRGGELLRFRLIEIAVFFLLAKIGGYLGESWSTVLADVQSWPNFLYRVFDLETMIAFILAIVAWHVSTQTARDFDRLDEPPIYHRYDVPPMDSLTGRFFWGGAALLILAGLTRIGVAQLLNLSRPSVPGLVLNVLVYFLLGLVMLGQVRFATLRKRWQASDVKIADELPRRWVRYSLALIGLAAFVAFLLPTGYTLGLLEVIGWILVTTLAILSLVATFLLWLILLPFAWLLSLLGAEPIQRGPVEPLARSFPDGAGANTGPEWFQILRSLVFWAIALGMVFYVVRSYLRDHPDLWENLAGLGVVRALRRWWTALGRWLSSWGATIRERMPDSWPLQFPRRRAQSREPFAFFRLGAAPPREQILYFYLSILQRAGRQGFPRRPAETPDEYRTTLGPNLPEAQQDVESLTQAFVEARYSQHAIRQEQANQVRVSWQHVKAALQALKQRRNEERG